MFQGECVKRLDPRMQQRAREKLKYLDSAGDLCDLMVPLSNQLEPLRGDRQGQYSIRINKQWRVCFKWKEGDATQLRAVRTSPRPSVGSLLLFQFFELLLHQELLLFRRELRKKKRELQTYAPRRCAGGVHGIAVRL